MRIKNVSNFLLDRYKIFRLLFHRDREYQSLLAESGLIEKKLIRVLGKLISDGFVSKKKIYSESTKEPDITELGIAKTMLGIKERKKFTHEYHLTSTGEKKLAYLEYYFQLYNRWSPQWDKGDEYAKSITEIIQREKYFGKPPK